MALKANKFRLGLFFSIGMIVFIVLIVWLTGGFREKQTTRYVSYFSWSVQGLNTGTNVMYNGVPVGRIASIDIAPDCRLVEVQMDIRSDFVVDSQIVAVMQLTGITGLSVINLSPDSTRSRIASSYTFQVEYPEIPVVESALQSAASILTKITEIVNEVDFQRISESTIELLENINAILDSETLERIEMSVLRNSEKLDTLLTVYIQLGRDLDRLVLAIENEVPGIAQDVGILAEELSELSEPLGTLIRRMDQVLVQSSITLENLSSFLEIISSNPGELFIQTSGEGVWR